MSEKEKLSQVGHDARHSDEGDDTTHEATLVPLETMHSQTVSEIPAAEFQDGGVRAWLQVLGCFFLWFNLWGYTFAFGTFQNFYEREYLLGTPASAIAWIGSIQSFLLIISGLWTGPIFDWGYYMYLIYFGSILSTFGAFMLSISTQYWQIFLTQGLCIGFGCGALFIPSMALIGRSFVKRRAIAVGLTTCGAPIGGILYTVIFNACLPKYGFAWTTRILGFFMLGSYFVAIPLLLLGAKNTSLSSGKKRKLFDKDALRDIPFWSYVGTTFTTFMAYLVPYFYMPSYAQTVLGESQARASYALIASQAASVPGRMLAAVIANYFGVMAAWFGCALISGIVSFAWIGANSYGGFVTFCALYGAFSGPLVPLPPSIFPVVCPDPKVLGTRLGMAQSVSSIANLLGPPLAGAILRATNSDSTHFLGVQLFVGLLMAIGAVQALGLWRLLITRRGAKRWV
ncbi:hypothetical protein LTR70_002856 [Exophiala xenobiotica]|uniref:Major facilitator superfamily (MFS) profile domain-containing protein n=1 Tax=Lithohypha guttulata TaxID=1690604 RepID=A0ABR0KJ13_9EURO|nr:hypothetical protein LTR24_002070 [Lithohypha guttulata]KAK5324572.1 hypothetical protein LTR70_002856 [Exophiala xenobiotica]